MDKFQVNIYIETSIHGPAIKTAAGMYIIEYILKSGEAETRSGILFRDNTTENALALETLEGAFRRLTKSCSVGVNTGCTHILNVMNNHYLSVWEKNGWINAKKKPVANRELWQQLKETMDVHAVSFRSEYHSYRKRMVFDLGKAMEAYRIGEEYHPDGQGKRVSAMSEGGYWIIW
ncbi:MAG: hypothetical protein MR992_00345 [Lachnospiraceae bacterium]|nr:hypothetical protein [Lachnospiraceae bacterium]MDD7627833.1 hypothetical protein [Lachnospiraceae bacterium]MDY4118791.1 RNase H family protein [Lachnospiraceae bacterium]